MKRVTCDDVIDAAMGAIILLTMLGALAVAGIICYQVAVGGTSGDDTAYVCTMDGDRMQCVKEEQ